jgi:hypothetical protein
MKPTFVAVTLQLILGFSVTLAGELDPRFEGIWVGTETYQIEASRTQPGYSPERMEAMIAIDPAGKAFGVLSGLGKGKYMAGKDSSGTKLNFSSQLTGTGRNKLTLILSADGTTISETGFGTYPCRPYACTCRITGTFHRKPKK